MNLTLNSISKIYKDKKSSIVALDDVSLSVTSGEFLALVGPSGSGKSTLLQIISGIEQPTSGQVLVDGQDISHWDNKRLAAYRREHIGIIFQQFYLDPVLSVRQNIELAGLFSRSAQNSLTKRTKELSELMGLASYLDRLPSEISGGQIQRAAIARAIFNSPQFIIADEPTSNLDHQNTEIIAEMLANVRNSYGATIIVATHDPSFAAAADRVVYLNEGRLSL